MDRLFFLQCSEGRSDAFLQEEYQFSLLNIITPTMAQIPDIRLPDNGVLMHEGGDLTEERKFYYFPYPYGRPY